MIKCKVCGKEFEASKENHYIARDNEIKRVGFAGLAGSNTEEESTLYDAFDCPACGCQIVAQERKRTFIDVCFAEEVDDDEECESES